ncbi:MAG: sulfite exporter TauE/SafE family protein [Candidatus Micrarchaeota archaeon]
MDFLLPAAIVLLLTGFFVIFGIGGASIFVPIFLQLGIGINDAIVAGLFINIISTGLATLIFFKSGILQQCHASQAGNIFFGMLISIPVGVWLSHTLEPSVLIGLFSLALFASAFLMVRKDAVQSVFSISEDDQVPFVDKDAKLSSASLTRGIVGIIAGLANGILGIGGGVFIVPSLILAGCSAKRAAVLSIVATFLGSLFSFANHIAYKMPNMQFLLALGIVAFIGSFAGSTLFAKGKIKSDFIQKLFPILLVIFALKLAIDFLGM